MSAVGGSRRIVVGRYVLCDVLAAGGMATVHVGRMIGPGGFSRTVAIKRLHEHFRRDPHFMAGLLDEARLSARVAHPNVVSTLDVVSTDSQLLLVMEYVHGESLARLLRTTTERGEPVPLRIAVGILAGALHGLHAAHDARDEKGAPLNIVHRDVSPQNIMVGVDGVARVLDFGIATAVGRLQDTATGQRKGKLSYMAPEQLQSQPIDRRTDIFAASIVLWELLTSRRLFAGEGEAGTMGNLLFRPIDPPSRHSRRIPPELDAVVMRGLSREPAGRYPTARDMALALEELIPPETAAHTGDWVQSLAEEALDVRANLIRMIESETSEVDRAQGASQPVALSTPPNFADPLRIQELPTAPRRSSVAAIIARRLAAYLGPHTAKVAVKTFSMKALGRGPETLEPADVPALQAALRPILRQLIGRAHCERILDEIARELER